MVFGGPRSLPVPFLRKPQNRDLPCSAHQGAGQSGKGAVSLQSSCSLPAQKPKVSENDFEDLLPNQGFSRSDKKGPKTMAEMRKQDLARDTDPLKLKVCG